MTNSNDFEYFLLVFGTCFYGRTCKAPLSSLGRKLPCINLHNNYY